MARQAARALPKLLGLGQGQCSHPEPVPGIIRW